MNSTIVNRSLAAVVTALLLAAPAAHAEAPPLTLAEAVASARANQPDLARAQATTRAAAARVDQGLAPLLPQVGTTASYGRQTSNVGGSPLGNSWDSTDRFSVGLTASQLVWDFGASWYRYKASGASLEAQQETEAAQRTLVVLGARAAFFQARAARALVRVAEQNLASQDRHLAQITGFVEAGVRPEIDRAQVKADLANARLQLVNARNGYAQAKAELNQAMGVERSTDYDVADEQLPAVAEEEAPEEQLVALAVATRPELRALAKQDEAQGLQLQSSAGSFWPSLGVSAGVSNSGADLADMGPNWNVGATLSWSLYSGGVTRAQVREQEATREATGAQTSAQRQQVRLEVVKARLGLGAAKAAVEATAQAVESTRERSRLAEARYQAGAGSILELQDAQVAVTNAEGQAIQAEFNVSLARAQLLRALGRE